MQKKKTVQSYPHWRQIGFEDCTKNRNEIKITEKLLRTEVTDTCYTGGGWLRLNVKGNYKDYK